MSFVRVSFCVVVIGMLTNAVAAVPDSNWHIKFGVSINDGTIINSSFGIKPGAIDWVGEEDNVPVDGMAAIIGDETKNAFAYTIVNTKVLTYDYRAPITNAVKTWNIWLTASEPGIIKLSTYSIINNPYYNGVMPIVEEPGHPAIIGDYDGGLASLRLWHGSDMLWNWQPGQMTSPIISFNYDGSAIPLKLVATPAPEPSSIAMILTGLCSFIGFVGKRKK